MREFRALIPNFQQLSSILVNIWGTDIKAAAQQLFLPPIPVAKTQPARGRKCSWNTEGLQGIPAKKIQVFGGKEG